MKRLIYLLLITVALLSMSACEGKKNETNITSSEAESSSTEAISEETSGVVAQTPETTGSIDYEKDTAYKDVYLTSSGEMHEDWYSAKGVMLYSCIKSEDGVFLEERFYGADGRLAKMNQFEDNAVGVKVTYEYESDSRMVWTLYDGEGTFFEKNVSEYQNNKIAYVSTLDENDVCMAEQIFKYDSNQKLDSVEENYFEDEVVVMNVLRIYNKVTGSITDETTSYYDAAGVFLYKDVYGIVDGKYSFVGRFNSVGTQITVDE